MKDLPELSCASLALALVAAIAPRTHAQCFEWTSTSDLPGLTGNTGYFPGGVRALQSFDDGSGVALYAGGGFTLAGSVPTRGLAKWNGTSWAAVDPHVDGSDQAVFTVSALGTFGADLFVGGIAPGSIWPPSGFVSRCAGGTSQTIGMFSSGEEIEGAVSSITEYAGSLYVAGRFNGVWGGPLGTRSIARWDGSAWNAVQGGIDYGSAIFWEDADVFDLAVYDGGSGPQLYAAGHFYRAGTITAYGIARWNGTTWSLAGAAPTNAQTSWLALAVFDDGNGRALYAATQGVGSYSILRFDGSVWSTIGTASHAVRELGVFDDGSGSALYAGGNFHTIGGAPANHIAKWNGTSWSALGAGVGVATNNGAFDSSHSIYALESFDDGSGPALCAGGAFLLAGGDQAKNVAAWQPCTLVGTPYCFGDGSLSTGCPCASPNSVPIPSSAPDAGCANSRYSSGAKLTASGTTSPDRVRLHGSSLPAPGFSVLIAGNGTDFGGVAYHDGVRCAGGTFLRFGAQYATSGTSVYPNVALGLTHPLSVVSGVTPGLGQARYYQALYRDAKPGFCSPGTLNLTSAVEIVW